MMILKSTHIGLGVVLALTAATVTRGEGGLTIGWYTIDGGGAMTTTGGSFELSGTIGQHDASPPATGGNLELTGGFWFEAAECAPPGFAVAQAGVSVDEGIFDLYIDPRAESNNGSNVNLGLDAITLKLTTPIQNSDGTPLSADRFSISDTAGTPPSIVGISTADGQTVTIELDGIITVQHWTRIGVSNVRSTCNGAPFNGSLVVGYLPCDVDQDRTVGPFDLLRFRQYANNVSSPAFGVNRDYIDTDRDGAIGPFDLLAFRQLVNGVSPPATQPWSGESLPPLP